MIKIIVNTLELEKIKYQVSEKIVPYAQAVNYYVDDIFIGTRLNEKDTIEFIPHFGNNPKVQEILDKYMIRYIKEEI